jgi:putative tricarboxylic transport membrane protein
MSNKDRVVGIIITFLGLIVFIASMNIPINDISPDPGSRLFPLIGSTGMIIFGAGIFLNKKESEVKPFMSRDGWIRLLKVMVIFIVYVLAIKYIGYLIASFIFMFVLVKLFAYERQIPVWKNALFSVIVTASIWIVFVKFLTVSLPSGKLW